MFRRNFQSQFHLRVCFRDGGHFFFDPANRVSLKFTRGKSGSRTSDSEFVPRIAFVTLIPPKSVYILFEYSPSIESL